MSDIASNHPAKINTRIRGFVDWVRQKDHEFSMPPLTAIERGVRFVAVLCVKFCKGGHGWLGSCGLAELNFLVLFEIVHIEIAVGFEPVLVGLDG